MERKIAMTTNTTNSLSIIETNPNFHYEIAKCIPQDSIPLLYQILSKYEISEHAKDMPFSAQVRELYLLPSLEISGTLPLLQTMPELFYIEYIKVGHQSRYLFHKRYKGEHHSLENSIILSKKQCKKILKGDLSFMEDSTEPLFLEYYSKHQTYQYRPSFIISCKRKRHIFNGGQSQITINDNVKMSFRTSLFLEEKDLPADSKTYASFRIQSAVEL